MTQVFRKHYLWGIWEPTLGSMGQSWAKCFRISQESVQESVCAVFPECRWLWSRTTVTHIFIRSSVETLTLIFSRLSFYQKILKKLLDSDNWLGLLASSIDHGGGVGGVPESSPGPDWARLYNPEPPRARRPACRARSPLMTTWWRSLVLPVCLCVSHCSDHAFFLFSPLKIFQTKSGSDGRRSARAP